MRYKKLEIVKALKMVLNTEQKDTRLPKMQNIQIFGNKICIDIQTNRPALQDKKKIEKSIKQALEKYINETTSLEFNFILVGSTPKTTTSLHTENPKKKLDNVSNIIAVASGKGGVGKSTIATNIAISLAKMGFKVGFLDADIYGPSATIMFDLENEKPLSVKDQGLIKMKPVENYGVKVLSIGFFTQPNQAVIWRGPMASKALNQLIFDAKWGALDFLLVDLPPGTGDIHLSIMQAIPLSGAVIVSTPQHVALADARKGIAMFRQELVNVPVLGIIENMSYFTPEDNLQKKYYIFGKGGAKNLADILAVPFLGEVPIEQSIREAADIGRPAALQENTLTESNLKKITQKVVEQVLERNQKMPITEKIKITNMSGCSAIKQKTNES